MAGRKRFRAGGGNGGRRGNRSLRLLVRGRLPLAPVSGVPADVSIESMHLQVGLEHSGILKHGKSGAALGGTPVALRQNMCGNAIAVELDGTARVREHGLQVRATVLGRGEYIGQQTTTRTDIGDGTRRALRVGEHRFLTGGLNLFARGAVGQASAEPGATALKLSCVWRNNSARCSAIRSLVAMRSSTPITAIAATAIAVSGTSSRVPRACRARTAITMITTNNAASAPARGRQHQRRRSRPFMNVPSMVGISVRYVCA